MTGVKEVLQKTVGQLRQRVESRKGEERRALTQPHVPAPASPNIDPISIDIESQPLNNYANLQRVATEIKKLALQIEQPIYLCSQGRLPRGGVVSIGDTHIGPTGATTTIKLTASTVLEANQVVKITGADTANDAFLGIDWAAEERRCVQAMQKYYFQTPVWYTSETYTARKVADMWSSVLTDNHWTVAQHAAPRTPEQEEEHRQALATQRANHEARRREWEAEAERQRIETAKADATAKELFLASLTSFERDEFDRTKAVTVISPSGKVYRVITTFRSGYHGNIIELDAAGQPAVSVCCAPGGLIPNFDKFLGQILALKYDEAAFVKAANRTKIDPKYRNLYLPPARDTLELAA
jgi:hypothetical protein